MTLRMNPRVLREKGWCDLAEKELWSPRRNSWSVEIGSFISIPDLQLRFQVVRGGGLGVKDIGYVPRAGS